MKAKVIRNPEVPFICIRISVAKKKKIIAITDKIPYIKSMSDFVRYAIDDALDDLYVET